MVGDAGGVNVFVMDNHPENGGSFHIYIVNSCDWMGEELPWAKELLTVLPMVCHVCILGWLHQRVERGLLLTRSLFSKVPTAGFSSHRLGCYSSLVSSQVLQRIPAPYPLISNTTSMDLRNEQIQGPKTILNPGFKGNFHIGWDYNMHPPYWIVPIFRGKGFWNMSTWFFQVIGSLTAEKISLLETAEEVGNDLHLCIMHIHLYTH